MPPWCYTCTRSNVTTEAVDFIDLEIGCQVFSNMAAESWDAMAYARGNGDAVFPPVRSNACCCYFRKSIFVPHIWDMAFCRVTRACLKLAMPDAMFGLCLWIFVQHLVRLRHVMTYYLLCSRPMAMPWLCQLAAVSKNMSKFEQYIIIYSSNFLSLDFGTFVFVEHCLCHLF